MQPQAEQASVSQLELFFDLVFVFALTQVTDLLAHEPNLTNLARSVLVLAVLWWAWVGYSWLGNVARADEGIVRVAIFGAMGAAFIIALTIPEAFDDLPGGLSGPVVFALAYFTVRTIHLVMMWVASDDNPEFRGQVLRWIPSVTLGTALLLAASQTTGTAQTLLWLGALAGDYVGTLIAGEGWVLRSVSHFAERHGLIIIVALGESIVSIGVGVAALPISWPIIIASMLGLAVSALLWWTYFDVASLAVEHELDRADGARQIKIARNSYSFGHLPMVIGVIMLSLGLKKVLSYVGGDEQHTLSDGLHGIPLVALYGGVVLFLLALVHMKGYATRSISWSRVVAAVAIVALVPVAAMLPALLQLGILCALLAILVAYETITYAAPRDEIRHGHAE